MVEKLYLMQDGTYARPGDVSPGKDGQLRAKSGVAVCYDADGKPQEINKGAIDNKNVAAAEAGKKPPGPVTIATTETMKPAPEPKVG